MLTNNANTPETQNFKCNACSGRGAVRPFGARFVVRCYRNGEICCQTRPQETAKLAIQKWEKMHK